MSRAFVKEDADADPVVVPARAPLPDGVPNLVTAAGLAALEREREGLEVALAEATAAGDRRRAATLAGQLDAVRPRLASARVVDVPERPETVAVGTDVTLRRGDGRTVRFRVVGVDEADPALGKVAFTAPLAAAALERRVGDAIEAQIGDAAVRFEVRAIAR